MRWSLLVLVALETVAAAEPRRVTVKTPVEAFTRPDAAAAPVLFFNRCSGGCAITGGTPNDAENHVTSIPGVGTFQVAEFVNGAGLSGAAADADWNEIFTCLREVYSPYGVTVVDVKPAAGVVRNEAVVAGRPSDIGLGAEILGIAPLAGDCSPQQNVMSFSFANHHGMTARNQNICWTAAQESAHAYGLDHEFEFIDGDSACNDPMTYRLDCGGQKFFRNRRARCGEKESRVCQCGATQNSHAKLIEVLGPGTPITPPPTAMVVFPINNGTITNASVVHVSAGSQRGVAKVELFFNGSRWEVMDGAAFGGNGQLDPSNYTFRIPAGLPDGVIDIYAKVSDDLGVAIDTAIVTVTKGAPCQTAATCAAAQQCTAGKCAFDAPQGELGDSCAYPQFCKSWLCNGPEDDQRCTQECELGEPTGCPSGLTCLDVGEAGLCWPADDGGCCSASDGGSLWPQGFVAFLTFGLIVGRRRRRRGE